MKAWGYYAISAVLTLATLPMYRYMILHAHDSERSTVSVADSVPLAAPPRHWMSEQEGDRMLRRVYPDKYVLSKNQHCYGGAIVEKNGTTYTSINGLGGVHATCANGYSDVQLR